MSADNYWLVRKVYYGGLPAYNVVMMIGEAEWPPLDETRNSFQTFEDVQTFLSARENWTEYPTVYGFPTQIVEVVEERQDRFPRHGESKSRGV